MKNSKKRIIIAAITIVASALLNISLFSSVHAASNFTSTDVAKKIEAKSYWHSLYTCYSLKNGGDKDYYSKDSRRWNANGTDFKNDSSSGWGQIDSEIEKGDVYKNDYYYDKWGFSYRKLFPNHNAHDAVYLPNGLTPAGDDSSNCAHVINGNAWDGGDGFKDTFYDRVGKSSVKFEENDTDSAMNSFMQGMGYTKEGDSGKSKCLKLSFHWKKQRVGEDSGASQENGDSVTNTACFDTSGSTLKISSYDHTKTLLQIWIQDYNYLSFFARPFEGDNYPESGRIDCEGLCNPQWLYLNDQNERTLNYGSWDWDKLTSEIKNTVIPLMENGGVVGCDSYKPSSGWLWTHKGAECNDKYIISFSSVKLVVTDTASSDTVWNINSDRNAAAQSAFTYLGGGSYASQKLTDSQRVVLYQYYIADLSGSVVKCDVSNPDSSDVAVKWFEDTKTRKNCYITMHAINDKTYNIAPGGYFGKPVSFDELVSELNGISITKLTDVDGAVVSSKDTEENSQRDPGKNSEKVEDDCYSKAGSLGWIICPIITTGADMVQNTYEGMIVPFLRMNPVLFKQDSGTYQAWDVFRNIANIAFVAMFLVVIVSQLTGYGIDNYGIKKILPKLIAAAILINASYIICQLAVDICNIIGASIGDLFTKIGDTIMSSQPEICKSSCKAASAGGSGSWIALIAVVMAITAVSLLALGPQILIPVLLAIISFVIAVFFLFVVLGIRQAVAVILVVASPLAFLCYMLPNTKKIFDKWLSMLKAVLIAYPICSAMVYGGDMVAKIILNTYGTSASNLASLTPILSAGIVAIAPIFLIPKVIKSSMGAIGNLSTRLQGGLSHRARGGANRRLQMSPLTQRQRYREKARMDRSQARMGEYNNRRAGRTLSRMNSRMDRNGQTVGDLSAAKRRQYMSAAGMVSAHDAEQQKAYAMSFENASPDSITASFNNMVSSGKYDKNLAHAAVQKLAEMNQHDKLNEMLGSMDSAYVGAMEVSDRAALGNQLAGLKGSNVAAGLYGKRLAAGGSEGLSQYMRSAGGFNADIKNAGKNVIASQDDSALSYIRSSGGRFTNEQMAQSIGNLDTKQQAQVNGMWSAMSDNDKADTFASMSTEQYSKIDESLATAVGNGSLDTGRDIINANTDTQREALAGEEGKNLRAAQNTSQQSISDWSKASEKERKRVAKAAGLKDWSDLDSTTQSKFAYDNNIQRKAGETDEQLNARATSEWRRQSGFNADLAKAAQKAGYHNV